MSEDPTARVARMVREQAKQAAGDAAAAGYLHGAPPDGHRLIQELEIRVKTLETSHQITNTIGQNNCESLSAALRMIRDLQNRVAALEEPGDVTGARAFQQRCAEIDRAFAYLDRIRGGAPEQQALRDIIALVDANQSCVWEETLDEIRRTAEGALS